jgi:hypothetical protein
MATCRRRALAALVLCLVAGCGPRPAAARVCLETGDASVYWGSSRQYSRARCGRSSSARTVGSSCTSSSECNGLDATGARACKCTQGGGSYTDDCTESTRHLRTKEDQERCDAIQTAVLITLGLLVVGCAVPAVGMCVCIQNKRKMGRGEPLPQAWVACVVIFLFAGGPCLMWIPFVMDQCYTARFGGGGGGGYGQTIVTTRQPMPAGGRGGAAGGAVMATAVAVPVQSQPVMATAVAVPAMPAEQQQQQQQQQSVVVTGSVVTAEARP